MSTFSRFTKFPRDFPSAAGAGQLSTRVFSGQHYLCVRPAAAPVPRVTGNECFYCAPYGQRQECTPKCSGKCYWVNTLNGMVGNVGGDRTLILVYTSFFFAAPLLFSFNFHRNRGFLCDKKNLAYLLIHYNIIYFTNLRQIGLIVSAYISSRV